MVLKYLGNDSWDRPVYIDYDGRLWKDTNPRENWTPALCTAVGNEFDGEPDMPMSSLKQYRGVEPQFIPNRVVW